MHMVVILTKKETNIAFKIQGQNRLIILYLYLYFNKKYLFIGNRVHGLNWIVMWDKIEGTKYENEGYKL